jgi:periplasmic protein TonB
VPGRARRVVRTCPGWTCEQPPAKPPGADFPRSGHSPRAWAYAGAAGRMIGVVHGPQPTRSALVARALALVTVAWFVAAAPAGVAAADACAYVSTGPDGVEVVAVAGDVAWATGPWPPEPPVCPQPPPTPTPPPAPPKPKPPPEPTPPPAPTPSPSPEPAPKPTPPPAPPPRPAPQPPPPPAPAAPRPEPPPSPAPPPAPPPQPTPRPAPRPTATPVTYPAYHSRPAPRQSGGGSSPVTHVLLITVPALVAVAALRPR